MESSFTVGKFVFKKQDGATWLKVFEHNCTNLVFFASEDEALESNTKQKYSILGLINDNFKIENRFVFLLEYPELKVSNSWKQSNNPLNEKSNVPNELHNVSGYEPIYINTTKNNWGGLARCGGCTLLEGSIGHSDWHYAIGQICQWGGFIPGPTAVSFTRLWIQVTDHTFMFKCEIKTQSSKMKLPYFSS